MYVRIKFISILFIISTIISCGCYENQTPIKDVSKPFLSSEYEIKDAVYSPDGRYIVFSSKMDGDDFFDIWMMTNDGKNLKQITYNDYNQKQPSMSHDNKKIVFSGFNNLIQSWNLYEYSIESKLIIQLTNNIFNQTFPIYSEDDSKVIYSSNEGLPKYRPLEGVDILRRIWVLDLNTMSKKLLYDSDQNCFHPALIRNTDKVVFSYEYHPELFEFFGSEHLMLYISRMNGSFVKKIDINECNIYYSNSINKNNIIFSISYWLEFSYNFGQCIGLYNTSNNNMTIILAERNYSIDQISYSPIENKILINCRNNTSTFVRKFVFNPVDNNRNGFADNIEDFRDRDPTSPLSLHYEKAKKNDDKTEKKEKQSSIFDNLFLIQIIGLLIIIILILVVIILFLEKDKGKKKKLETKGIDVKFIEEK